MISTVHYATLFIMLVFCEVKRLRVVRNGVFVNYYECVVVTWKEWKEDRTETV